MLPFDNRLPLGGPHGAHDYDNTEQDMQAVFYAWGPAFKQGLRIKPFKNVDVYPLVAKILGLSITEKIDGDMGGLKNALR